MFSLSGQICGKRNDPRGIFDSMRLKKVDRNRLHAWIEFSDNSGMIKEQEFEGTRDELCRLIESDPDLLDDEKCHLLQSLEANCISDPSSCK